MIEFPKQLTSSIQSTNNTGLSTNSSFFVNASRGKRCKSDDVIGLLEGSYAIKIRYQILSALSLPLPPQK